MRKKTNPLKLQFIAESIRKGECVFFIGAGVSCSDGDLPNAKLLTEILAGKLNVKASHYTLPEIASKFQMQFDRVSLIDLLRANIVKRIDVSKKGMCKILKKIYTLPVRTIITTNYDNLIERVYELKGTDINVIKTDRQISSWREGSVQLLKIHGDFSVEPDKLIITTEDYKAYKDTHRSIITTLQTLFNTKNIVFLGYSLNDINFRSIHDIVVENLGSLKRKCFAVHKDKLPDKDMENWRSQNLAIINSDAYKFVKDLAKEYFYVPEKPESKFEEVSKKVKLPIKRPHFKDNSKFVFRKRFAFNIGIRKELLRDYYYYGIVLDSMIFDPEFLSKSKLKKLVFTFSNLLFSQLSDLSRDSYFIKCLPPIFTESQKDRKKIVKYADLIIIFLHDKRYPNYINSLYGPVSKEKKFIVILHRNFNKRLDTDLVLIGLESLNNKIIPISSSSLKENFIIEEIHRLISINQENKLHKLILSETLEDELK